MTFHSADLHYPDEPIHEDQEYQIVVRAVTGGQLFPRDITFYVLVNGTQVYQETFEDTLDAEFTIQTDTLPRPADAFWADVGTNTVTVDTEGWSSSAEAGTFEIVPEQPDAESTVTSLTTNLNNIQEGQQVKCTAIHRSWFDFSVRATLVINRMDGGERTLFTDEVVSDPTPKEEVVPVQLEVPGDAELCAFLTDREVIGI